MAPDDDDEINDAMPEWVRTLRELCRQANARHTAARLEERKS